MILLDLLAVNLLVYFFITHTFSWPVDHIFLSVLWLVMAYFIKFYEVYRFTKVTEILSLWIRQLFFFTISFYAFIGLFSLSVGKNDQIYFLGILAIATTIFKLSTYFLLRQFRAYLGGNRRNVIIVGSTKAANQLAHFFNSKNELGYHLKGIFANKNGHSNGTVEDSFEFLEKHPIDEIYCSIEELSDKEVNRFVRVADEKFYTLKFIPNQSKLLTQKLDTQYYGYLPVLTIKQSALDKELNLWVKRIFDIGFSILVILFVLSWLIPILFILVKLDSKGPLFYKHTRYGINYQPFTCYKFRSMVNKQHDSSLQVKRNDARVTKMGRIMRRTSIDELPQFFNVLLGDMSVVGPRPHMVSFTEEYAKLTDKYNFLLRHTVKPGVTGLAQTRGFRGEVSSKEDIVNRVKFDNFYIENWSLILDVKIILQTMINLLKGQEKAY